MLSDEDLEALREDLSEVAETFEDSEANGEDWSRARALVREAITKITEIQVKRAAQAATDTLTRVIVEHTPLDETRCSCRMIYATSSEYAPQIAFARHQAQQATDSLY